MPYKNGEDAHSLYEHDAKTRRHLPSYLRPFPFAVEAQGQISRQPERRGDLKAGPCLGHVCDAAGDRLPPVDDNEPWQMGLRPDRASAFHSLKHAWITSPKRHHQPPQLRTRQKARAI
jgi:hypothetical protein